MAITAGRRLLISIGILEPKEEIMTTASNRVSSRPKPADPLSVAGELKDNAFDAVSGGWFAFHATAEAIDAVAKALATMAQKQ
jgi:hypothetical protein